VEGLPRYLWEASRASRPAATPADYPFWLLTARSMQYAWGGNVGVQMIKEVADNVAGHNGVIMNPQAAAGWASQEGDPVEIATPAARRAARRAAPGHPPRHPAADGPVRPLGHAAGQGLRHAEHEHAGPMSMALTDATGSGADIVRVKVSKQAGGDARP
jgi:phenylacetyl-CoA:acceptor oxidoreductase